MALLWYALRSTLTSVLKYWFLWIRFEYRKWFLAYVNQKRRLCNATVNEFHESGNPEKDWRQIKQFLMFSSKKMIFFPCFSSWFTLQKSFLIAMCNLSSMKTWIYWFFCKIFFYQSRRCFWGFPEKITDCAKNIEFFLNFPHFRRVISLYCQKFCNFFQRDQFKCPV